MTSSLTMFETAIYVTSLYVKIVIENQKKRKYGNQFFTQIYI